MIPRTKTEQAMKPRVAIGRSSFIRRVRFCSSMNARRDALADFWHADATYRRTLISAIAILSITDSGVEGNPYVEVVVSVIFAGGALGAVGLISLALKIDFSP
jgi:hypothetical protein